MNQPQIVPTIIIAVSIHDDIRGYSLTGREFFLKEPHPRKTVASTLDGVTLEEKFWVIDLNEYLRVVPEAQKERFTSDEILIPVYVARVSFRPKYLPTQAGKQIYF
jgi:hypothetical protein